MTTEATNMKNKIDVRNSKTENHSKKMKIAKKKMYVGEWCEKNNIPIIPTKLWKTPQGNKIPLFIQKIKLPNTTYIWSPNNHIPFHSWDNKQIEDHIAWLKENGKYEECDCWIVIIKDTEFCVVDTDSEEEEQEISAMEEFSKTPRMLSYSGRGTHRYCKIGDGQYTKQIQVEGRKWDFLTDYVFECMERTVANPKQETIFTQEIFEEMFGIVLEPRKTLTLKDHQEIEGHNKNTRTYNIKDTIRNNFLDKDEVIPPILLFEILDSLNPNAFQSRDMWVKLVYAIYNSVPDKDNDLVYLNKLQEICSKMESYKPTYFMENQQLWSSITLRSGDIIKSGTIWYWCMEQNPEKFIELKRKRRGGIDKPAFNSLARNYEKQKAYFQQYNCKINGQKCLFHYDDEGARTFQKDYERTREDLKAVYQELITITTTEDKKGKTQEIPCSFVDKWLNDASKREYDRVDFLPPPLHADPFTLNTYTGLFYEDIKIEEYLLMTEEQKLQQIDPILRHVHFLCEERKDCADYFLNWCSHKVQYPAIKTNVGIVMRSGQGVGKNAYTDWFGKKILGEKYYACSSNVNDYLGQFNAFTKSKLLLVFNEMLGENGYKYAERIKEMITETTISHEQKYQGREFIRNCCDMLFFSNTDNPVEIEPTDRRFWVVKCSSKTLYIPFYFDDLFKCLDDPLTARCYVWYLVEKINCPKDYNFKEQRPETAVYNIMKQKNKPLMVRFLEWFINDWDGVKKTKGLKNSELWDYYKLYKEETNNRGYEQQKDFNSKLKEEFIYDNKTTEDELKCSPHKVIRKYKSNTIQYEINVPRCDELFIKYGEEY